MPGGGPAYCRDAGEGSCLENSALRDLPGLSWALAGLRRHKGTVAGVWLAVTVAAAAWFSRLPDVYRSEALVLVECHRIPERLVPASVTPDLEIRLERARQKLLSSGELQAVIQRLNLFLEQRRADASGDSLVVQLRGSVAIASVGPGAAGRLGPFRVTVQDPDPETAARVANHLASRFIEEASLARRSSSTAAARFLSAHVASAKRELDEREAALSHFRLRNPEELPERAESLRANARRLRVELAALRNEIQALERDKAALEQGERTFVPKLPAAAPPGPRVPGNGLTNGAAARPSRTEALKLRLTTLLAVYQPEHPDVRKLRAELAQAQRLESEAAAGTLAEAKSNGVHPEAPQPSPGNSAARFRLGQIEVRLEALASRRIQAAAELGATEHHLQRVPLRQQELAVLTREQAFFNEQFRSLAARLQSAEMAQELERNYPSERVLLLEPARPAEKPVGSKRWALLCVASLGGLLIGCLLAIARTCQAAAWSRPQPVAATARGGQRRSYITA